MSKINYPVNYPVVGNPQIPSSSFGEKETTFKYTTLSGNIDFLVGLLANKEFILGYPNLGVCIGSRSGSNPSMYMDFVDGRISSKRFQLYFGRNGLRIAVNGPNNDEELQPKSFIKKYTGLDLENLKDGLRLTGESRHNSLGFPIQYEIELQTVKGELRTRMMNSFEYEDRPGNRWRQRAFAFYVRDAVQSYVFGEELATGEKKAILTYHDKNIVVGVSPKEEFSFAYSPYDMEVRSARLVDTIDLRGATPTEVRRQHVDLRQKALNELRSLYGVEFKGSPFAPTGKIEFDFKP